MCTDGQMMVGIGQISVILINSLSEVVLQLISLSKLSYSRNQNLIQN